MTNARGTAGIDLALDIGAKLTDKQIQAVALRVAGYTHREIAESVGVCRSAVTRRLDRAKQGIAMALGWECNHIAPYLWCRR